MEQKQNKVKMNFAAIDKVLETNIVSPTETVLTGRPFVIWGDSNIYPDYLYDLYMNVSTLHSVVEGTVDFICGDGSSIDSSIFSESVNLDDESIEDLIRKIATDMVIYNGFAINVLRNKAGNVCGLYHIPIQRLRSNADKTEFFYSEDWSRSYGRVKTIRYNAFDKNVNDPSSIYYYSANPLGVYPIPTWCGAVMACEIERKINMFHLNSLENGFAASYMICMNNGIPDDNIKKQIEEYVEEKLSGSYNAGRILISFAADKDHATEMVKLDSDDYGQKYQTLIERTSQEIFTSFRATPNLFGLPTKTTGFNSQEYMEAFKLYNRTVVRPKQKTIVDAINYITDSTVQILPFSLE